MVLMFLLLFELIIDLFFIFSLYLSLFSTFKHHNYLRRFNEQQYEGKEREKMVF